MGRRSVADVGRGTGYTNGDDCLLAWTFPITSACRGFTDSALRPVRTGRRRTACSVTTGVPEGLSEGLRGSALEPVTVPALHMERRRGERGDTVTYMITPMVGLLAEPWRSRRPGDRRTARYHARHDGRWSSSIEALFNRGIRLPSSSPGLPKPFTNADVRRSFAARRDGRGAARVPDGTARRAAGRPPERVRRRPEAEDQRRAYELSDDVLVDKLGAIQQRADIVLSNGGDTPTAMRRPRPTSAGPSTSSSGCWLRGTLATRSPS